jgi:cytochrome c-type biogenesis protein
MEFTLQTLLWLPAGLGLLGFIEPCTIGGHLIFLSTQNGRSRAEKMNAVLVFIAVRALTVGMFGAMISYAGHYLVSLQTNLWLVFGSIYLLIGGIFLAGKGSLLKQRIDFAPTAWKSALNPVTLGLAFGLNIPACAAPIIFGLLGLASSTGSVLAGFMMMFVFGFALSAPLIILVFKPALTYRLEKLGNKITHQTLLLGLLFILLGVWSIWFGLYVDPAKWA